MLCCSSPCLSYILAATLFALYVKDHSRFFFSSSLATWNWISLRCFGAGLCAAVMTCVGGSLLTVSEMFLMYGCIILFTAYSDCAIACCGHALFDKLILNLTTRRLNQSLETISISDQA